MSEHSDELVKAVCEIRDLVRLLAEPAIAERDRKPRDELRRIVGRSSAKAKSALLMDGARTQREIQRQTGINQGDLSVFVKKLKDSKLLIEGAKQPRLAISVPANFFESGEKDE